MIKKLILNVVVAVSVSVFAVLLASGVSIAQDGEIYTIPFDAENFEKPAENPWFPMKPGMRWEYRELDNEGEEEARVSVEVTRATKTILGVRCTVIHDQVVEERRIVEDTLDYYAADRFGNIWYFGEDSRDFERGSIVSVEGSWLAGADGAMPGLFMAADPEVGMVFQQEVSPGQAEDMAQVVEKNVPVRVKKGKFENCIKVKEWNPLEPGITEYKYYSSGMGVVLEEEPKERVRVELYKFKK